LRGGFGFPITLGSEVLGVLDFFSPDLRQPDDDILKMMTAVGSQIGQFIERKQAEAELRESNHQLRTLIQASPLAIVALDPKGIVQAWNPAAERIFGWSADEVMSRPVPYIPPEKQREYQTVFREEQDGKYLVGFETQRMRKDGSRVEIRISTAPIQNAGGEVVGFLGLIADITEEKQMEAQFHQAQKMEAVGQLAGGVAHDFNNLLTIIQGYSSLLLQKLPVEDKNRRFVQEIHRAGERSESLTQQLLVFSRKQVVTPKVLDLNAVAADADKMLRRLIGEDVRLTTTVWPHEIRVRADQGQLEQVLMNLAVNARDAMPQGGVLTIETSELELADEYARVHADVPAGFYARLTVTDTGSGMTPEVRAKIFEPFFSTKGPGKGTGLGLAVVHGIVKQSGGQIEVESKPGVGTSFTIYLPRVDQPIQHKLVSGEQPVPRGSETILLVEDEDRVRELTREILTDCGYTVVEAADGNAAIRTAQQHAGPIPLLVTDVVMPGMGGRIVAERVRLIHPEARVLYVSGYTDDAVVRHGILLDEVAFLQKPFTPQSLAFKVRELLDSH